MSDGTQESGSPGDRGDRYTDDFAAVFAKEVQSLRDRREAVGRESGLAWIPTLG